MNLITRLIGLNILVVMLFGAVVLGGKTSIYIDIPSIVMIVAMFMVLVVSFLEIKTRDDKYLVIEEVQ